MPCDSVIQIELKLDTARVSVLDAALKTLGFTSKYQGQWVNNSTAVVVNLRCDGELMIISNSRSSRELDELRTKIMVETSKEIVKRAAAKQGWSLNWTAGGKNLKGQASKMTYGV